MDKLIRTVLEGIASKKIDKETGAKLLLQIDREKPARVDIAIVGIGVRAGRCNGQDEFWKLIINNEDLSGEISKERKKDINDCFAKDNYKYQFFSGSYFDRIDLFDNEFFRISPNEAKLIDPAQRILLEVAWQAMEDSGYGANHFVGTNTGVFIGFSGNYRDKYQKIIEALCPEELGNSIIGNTTSVIAGRLSYLLDLKGPAMVLDSACSSSLVAVDAACKAIESNECDSAIVCGVKVETVPIAYGTEKIGIESSDGRTYSFSEGADGSGSAEGAGVIILKTLEEALKNNDNIYAVIKGRAVGQDGNSIGISAPDSAAQGMVIKEAIKRSGVKAEQIEYIEAHGTATKLGDPVELKGISNAFRDLTPKRQFCALSTIKSNIGHASEAAGILGIIKACLALKNEIIPASINFISPNSEIDFIKSPIFINTKNREWKKHGIPRVCGISAFGVSGTNAHVILEEAIPVIKNREEEQKASYIFTLSARTETSFNKLLNSYLDFLKIDMDLVNICYTSNTGRGFYDYRLAIVCRTVEELINQLERFQKESKQEPYVGIYYNISPAPKTNKVFQVIEKIENLNIRDRDDFIVGLCMKYTAGKNCDFSALYEKAKRVSLPSYCFDENRCWVESNAGFNDKQSVSSMYHEVLWVKGPAHKVNGCSGRNILFLSCLSESCYRIEEYLSQNSKVIQVDFTVFEEWMKDEKSFNNIIGNLIIQNNINCIVDGFLMDGRTSLESADILRQSERKGYESLFCLIRALIFNNLNIKLLLLVRNVDKVDGEETYFRPDASAAIGLANVAWQEYSNLSVKTVDFDEQTMLNFVFGELDKDDFINISYRNNVRYHQKFQKVNMPDEKEEIFRDKGVYLISGGLGGIGLEVAKAISAGHKTVLALLSRQEFPLRKDWDRIFMTSDDRELCSRIRAVREMEASGSTVEIYQADVSDYERLKIVLEDIRTKYGHLNGVIHGAGIGGQGFIIHKDIETLKRVISPKYQGTWNLDMLTAEDDLDIFVMFSSIVTMGGEPGQGDYCAANSFIDSFTTYRSARAGKTLTVNWCAWKETGMAKRFQANVDHIFRALLTKDAINCFLHVLASDKMRIIIGEINSDSEDTDQIENLKVEFDDELMESIKNISKRKKGRIKDVTVEGLTGGENQETVNRVAQVYATALGYDHINIDDNFFEIGGNSIMMSKMYQLLSTDYKDMLSYSDLFEYTTVRQLTEFIEGKTSGKREKDDSVESLIDEFVSADADIDDILSRLGGI